MNRRVIFLIISLLIIFSLSFYVYARITDGASYRPLNIGRITSPANATLMWVGNDPSSARPKIDLNFVGSLFTSSSNFTTNVSWVLRGVTSGINYTLVRVNDTLAAGTQTGNVTNVTNLKVIPTSILEGYYNLTIVLYNVTGNFGDGDLDGSNIVRLSGAFSNTSTNNLSLGSGAGTTIGVPQPAGHNIYVFSSLRIGGINISTPEKGTNISGTYNFTNTISAYNMTTNVTWIAINDSGGSIVLGINSTTNGTFFSFNTANLRDGNYTIFANATNNSAYGAGSSVVDSNPNVKVDNNAPAVTITLSEADAKIFTRGELKVTCTSVDGGGTGVLTRKIEVVKPNGDVITKSDVDEFTFKDLDTSATGSYTARCIAEDYVALERKLEKAFDVRVRSSSGAAAAAGGVPSFDYDLSEKITHIASAREGQIRDFTLDGTTRHEIQFKKVTETTVTLVISSEPQEITLNIGESKEVDLNDDGKNDLKVILNTIVNGRANLSLDKLEGAALITPEEEIEPLGEGEPEREAQPEPGPGEPSVPTGFGTTAIIIIVIVIVFVVGYFLWKGKGKGKKGHIKFSRSELKAVK